MKAPKYSIIPKPQKYEVIEGTYTITVSAKDAAGNTSESRVVTTDAFPTIPSDITITESPKDVWSTSKVITIEYPDTYGVYPYKNLYRIDDGEWQEVTSNKEEVARLEGELLKVKSRLEYC